MVSSTLRLTIPHAHTHTMPQSTRFILSATLALSAATTFAQPGPPAGRGAPGGENRGPDVQAMVERLLTFDANQDGALTRAELTDERLHPLFLRADANGDGTVSKAELVELFTRESAALGAGGRRAGPPPDAGPGGPPRGERGPDSPPPDRGPNDRAPGDRGPGRDMAGGPRPRPGQILPPGMQERLNLTEDQRRRINALQEIVDTQLASILTDEQRRLIGEPAPPPAGPRGDGPPRERQRPGADGRPARPANEP